MPKADMSAPRPAADPAAARARAAGSALAALSLSSQDTGAPGAVISRKEWLAERKAAAAAAAATAATTAAAPSAPSPTTATAAAAAGAVSVGSQHQSVLRAVAGSGSSAVLVAAVPPSPAQPRGQQSGKPSGKPSWKQLAASQPAARADALVAALRPEEWAALTGAGGGAEAAAGTTPRDCAYAGVLPGLEAHGLPALRMADGAAGFRTAGECAPRTTTLWPSALAVAATWDPQAAASWGGALGAEARRKGAGVLLAPDLRLAAAPRDARNAERLSGEDPTLGAALGAAAVRGIQSQGIVAAATADLAAPEPAEPADPAAAGGGGRTRAPLSPRARREMSYPPLAAAVAAGLGGLACAAAPSAVENATADGCADAQAVRALREAIGFEGFVLARGSPSAAGGGGADLQLPGSEGGAAVLHAPEAAAAGVAGTAAAAAGTAGAAEVDGAAGGAAEGGEARWGEAARRVLRPMLTLGQLERAQPPREAVEANATSGEHADLARQIAAAGAVLLQNTGELLPLSAASLESLAVIGDAAHLTATLAAAGADASRLAPPRLVSALDGVKAHLADSGSSAVVTYTPTGSDGGRAAAAAAAAAQLALVCVAAPAAEEGAERPGLALAPRDLQLLQSVLSVQPNAVVVVTAPGSVLLPFAPGAAALLLGFMPGQEWGSALADLLFGATSPSGKLPVSLPMDDAAAAAPATPGAPAAAPADAAVTAAVGAVDPGLLVGYRGLDARGARPRFAFGHGLTYSSFELSDLALEINPRGGVLVRATLHNVGARAAAETAQLYLGLPAAAGAPPRQLKGFVKRFLQPGERNRISFAISAAELTAWDATSRRVAPAVGEFAVFVGTSSRALPLGATFVQAASGLASLEPVEADRTSPPDRTSAHRDSTSAAAAAAGGAGPAAALGEQPTVLAEQQRVAVEQAFGPQADEMQMQMPGLAPRLA